MSDSVPSEASYLHLITKLVMCGVLENQNENFVHQAIEEGFIKDETATTVAYHFEARDQAPPKKEKPKPKPKNAGENPKKNRNKG